ncbi:hypothetical protein [Microbacterium sp. 22242]|uniref:hypothetical protein n=1 Tax=Microbacterium sp. 22242 TaxID=3453896 RepID=UPI003F859A2E
MEPETDAMVSDAAMPPNQTLIWGGTLILLAGLGGLLFAVSRTLTASLVASSLFCAACVLFAVGMRSGGSVVGRSVWGRIGLVGTGAVPLVSEILLALSVLNGPGQAVLTATFVLSGVAGLCAIVATVAILRQRAVPRPWRWIPLYAIGIVETINLLAQGSVSGTQTLDISVRLVIGRIATALLWIGYGVISLMLARRIARLESMPRPVIEPGEANLGRRS